MPEAKRLAVVLMGTGPFAVPSYEAIRAAGHDIRLVITRPEAAGKSRKRVPPSPVRQWASEQGLPISDPASINDPEALGPLTEASPDVLVVCDYGQILKTHVLEAAPLGGINLHGSLLPAYRGAAPVQWAMKRGEFVTGVSVIHMTARLDAGPVLVRHELAIGDKETAGELETRLAATGVDATLEALQLLATWDGTSALGTPQDASQRSAAPRLTKADGRIDWSLEARQIDCHVRAMQPWPTAFTEIPASDQRAPVRIVVRRVEKSSHEAELPSPPLPPGTLLTEHGMHVACGDGYLRIDRLQPAGKREMTADAFLRGRPVPSGTTLH